VSCAGSINFGRLISGYVIPFQARQPFFAIRYYFLLRDKQPPGHQQGGQAEPELSLFTFLVAHLLIETKLYESILGKRKEDGEKTPAEIDMYQDWMKKKSLLTNPDPLRQKVNPVIDYVARKYELDGQMIDAIRLYHLAKEENNVLRLLNLELTNDSSDGLASGGDELFDLAQTIRRQYETNPRVEKRRQTTLEFLLKLFQHRRFFYKGNGSYIDAIDVLKRSPVVCSYLPFKSTDVQGCVAKFDEMAEEVRRQLPTVLSNIMDILAVQYRQFQAKPTAAAQPQIEELREHAKTLIAFVNKIPYRMPWDVMNELLAHHASIAA
jgi:hypothetical protein